MIQDYDSSGPDLGFLKILGLGLLVLLLLVGVGIGGRELGWWLKADNTNRQSNIDRKNFGSQLAYITKVQTTDKEVATINVQLSTPGVSAEQKDALGAQKIALVNQGCATANLIVDKPNDVANFVTLYCN